MRRLFCAIIVLVLLMSNLCLYVAEEAERPVHNYMLIIDNSRSTTGQHSLGAATDPKGLRFDAARLVYENVLSSAEAGGKGKIGVIVFCGTENCVCYGPMDIDAEPDALDTAIGSHLNEAANQNRRDNYTDIRTALENARDMIHDFKGTTSVILLTDGVNDLTNLSDPFSQPENIEANEQSVEIVGELQSLGADFYIIALTAQDSVSNTDDFLAFINRMAEAGGGKLLDNGMYSNVLMATQADLNSKLLQTLIKAENAKDLNIDDQVLHTPITWPFSVPYSDISDATVNITFMPQDKARLKTLDLITPEGKTYSVYVDGAAQPSNDISITDDRSYIILSIPSPAPGEWQLKLSGQKDAEIPIDIVVRFNHQLRIRMDSPQSVSLGEKVPIKVWLQRYNGERYEDLDDVGIYALSDAKLTLLSPTKGSTAKTLDMRRQGNRFTASVKLKTLGTWIIGASIENDYLVERLEGITVEVLPAPTANPTASIAASASTGQETQGGQANGQGGQDNGQGDEAGGQGGQAYSQGDEAGGQGGQADGQGDEAGGQGGQAYSQGDEAGGQGGQADDQRDEADSQGGQDNGQGDEAGGQGGQADDQDDQADGQGDHADGQDISENGNKNDGSWKVEADANSGKLTVAWEGEGTEDARAELHKTGSDTPVISDIRSGDKIDVGDLEPDQEYQIMLVAYSGDADDGGTPPMQPLDIQLIPDAENVGNAILTIADTVIKLAPYVEFSQDMTQSGIAAQEFQNEEPASSGTVSGGNSSGTAGLVKTTDESDGLGSNGASTGSGIDENDTITEGKEAETSASEDNSHASGDADLGNSDPGDATPSVSPEEDVTEEKEPEAGATGIQGILNLARDNWMIAAGGAGLLALIVVIVVIARNAFGEKVTGNLKIVCEKIGLEMLLNFDGHNSLRSNTSITKHPDIAKLKGGKFYDVLSNLQVSATQADESGQVSGSEVHHMPNDKLITITYTDPRTGNQQSCHVGRLDSEEAVLNVYDAGRTYELHFSGNLSFEELSKLSGKR